ncbi:DUF3093 domain-containing protein [Nocardioides limicola]|uniref:DUF3093 domain-containing protein n=1 Tax=Nocardioides limicola TaxID=2803368 RepID=UPI00193B6D90|nr:DUF3093 domain-containing protein [Nocardioides sp. DJM-14]
MYVERLGVPLRWWVQGTMLLACFWLAFIVTPMPEAVSWALTGVIGCLIAGGYLWYGAATIRVDGSVFTAGRAHIDRSHIGEVLPLDTEAAHRLAGRDADARAHLLLRPYCRRAVRVEITDPRDPTPYWLISTRHPRKLAAALGWTADSAPAVEADAGADDPVG